MDANFCPVFKIKIMDIKAKKKSKNVFSKCEVPEVFINQEKVLEAVKIIRQLILKKTAKPQLFEDIGETAIFLQVSFRRIPSRKDLCTIKISLPHSILKDSAEVCLISGDLDKSNHKAESEKVVEHYKELLNQMDITRINEVIPLRQLRTEYKTYEAKRQLLGAYDVFLCDSKIAGVLPRLLGKQFFQKRKFPMQVNLSKPSLPKQIEKVLTQTTFNITCRGNSYASEVALLSMDDEAITKNIVAFVNAIAKKVPGKWPNISGLYLKTAKSESIPIYISYDDGVKLPSKKRKIEVIEDDLSTVPNYKVRVFKDGTVRLKKSAESL